MLARVLQFVRARRSYARLSPAARAELEQDHAGLPEHDPGIQRVVDTGIQWLARAQDQSASHDGGVAREYSLLTGWNHSYPETTGYIIPTLLAYAKLRNDEESRQRARRMLDWLVSIQFPDGGFQGGTIDATPVVPVTFNTGQILLGLASGAAEFGDEYRRPMRRAADWLVRTQDPDGCWRKHPTPFAEPGEKVYETHVSWGLFEAARVAPEEPYAGAARKNLDWALTHQRDNGWFDKCCLIDSAEPLTHTIGYVLRGLLEGYRFSGDGALLAASRKTADGLLSALGDDGFLPGHLDANWRGTVPWVCLTGSAQVAHCWLLLFQATGDIRYRDAGYAANQYVRRTVKVDAPPDTRGGVKGSFPVDGGYGTYEYLNWACKFTIDSNLLESTVREQR